MVMMNIKHISTALAVGATAFLGVAPVASASSAPTKFEPGSVSFLSASQGFLLGTAPCGHASCTSLLTTVDGGKKWTKVAAPSAPFTSYYSQSSASVSEVVFANASDGWVYGPSLWATHDGAATWQKLNLGGPVYSLAASGKVAYAIVGSCAPGAKGCQAPALRLETTTVGSSTWRVVPGVSGYGSAGLLTVNGGNAWVSLWPRHPGAAALVWRSGDGGAVWHSLPDSCYQPSQATDLAGLASPGGSTVYELCAGNPGAGSEGKSLRVSSNGGSTSHVVSHLPLGGIASAITAAGSHVFVTAASGATMIYGSSNEGKTWVTRTFDDGGAGLYDFNFVTSSFVAAIHGQPQQGSSTLLLSNDGGATWSSVES
jgi:photosystem II stability/assembly factor-like uncharacterized protein